MKYQSDNFNGILDFKCKHHDGWVMESHLHGYSEILYCKKGSIDVLINSQQIHIPEKHLIWIPPNYIHQFKQTDAELICAVFSDDFIPLFFQVTKGKRMVVAPIDFSDMSEVLSEFHTIDGKNYLLINGYLNLICAKVVESSAFEKEKQTDGILYQKVVSYISSHFKEDISLKAIAKKFGYNEKYLSHSLYGLTGIHFSKLLSMYRIEYAKKLLDDEKSAPVSEIALESGFSAINTFNRVFKEFTGMTPSVYRNGYLNNSAKLN